ncbi:MAG: Gfo/Idh/MocA family protein [Planctomycetota bacterium]
MTTMNTKITRRGFVRAGVSALVISGMPSVVPCSVFGSSAPSNRVAIGCVGLGGMGMGNLRGFLNKEGTQIVAVCDVVTSGRTEYGPNANGYGNKGKDLGREPARRTVEQHYAGKRRDGRFRGCRGYSDFRDLAARTDIDAVVVTTPDHWHVPIALAAIRAGKDVYCEKPLSLTIREGRILADTVRRYGRILQTGTQHRSNSRRRFICELIRNGRIGKLHTIKCSIGGGPSCEPQPAMAVPKGFDYEMWLGQAPQSPYTEKRCHYYFRFIWDYAGGQVTNNGVHALDFVQWANGTDLTGPVEIEGRGDFPKDGLFDTPTSWNIEYTYVGGVKLLFSSGKGGVRFEGTEGWIQSSPFDAHPKSLLTSVIDPNELHLYKSNDHKQDFLNCMRTRTDPIAHVEIGHRSASICHLGNIAMLTGRKLKWNPDRESFVSDPEANRMLSRSMRSPWRL